jgi:hypothetical protein
LVRPIRLSKGAQMFSEKEDRILQRGSKKEKDALSKKKGIDVVTFRGQWLRIQYQHVPPFFDKA